MKVVIDRFEGPYAICEKEDMSMIQLEICNLPRGVKEGDTIEVNGDTVSIDIGETQKRKNSIEKLAEDLWK